MSRRMILLFGQAFLGFFLLWECSIPLAAEESPAASAIKFPSKEDILGHVWNQFLAAMRSGNDRAVRSQCTSAGYQSLVAHANSKEALGVQWRRWGEGWSKWGVIRWRSITSVIAYGKLGPKEKEAAINFALTPEGWKLDQWSPGE
jgi:hypothetical protein